MPDRWLLDFGKIFRVSISIVYLFLIFFLAWVIFFVLSMIVGSARASLDGQGNPEYIQLATDFFVLCVGLTIVAVLADHLKNVVTSLVKYVRVGHSGGWQGFLGERLWSGRIILSVVGISLAAMTAKSGGEVVSSTERIVEKTMPGSNTHREITRFEPIWISGHPLSADAGENFLWRVRFPDGRLRAGISCVAAASSKSPEDVFTEGADAPLETFSGEGRKEIDRLRAEVSARLKSCNAGLNQIVAEIKLTGFSSDAPFRSCPDESDAINSQLEIARASAVARWLAGEPLGARFSTEIRSASRLGISRDDEMRNTPFVDMTRSTLIEVRVDCPEPTTG